MDKFIFRGILILCCLIISIVLIVTPVVFHMYLRMTKTEIRIEKKQERIERMLMELNRLLQKE